MATYYCYERPSAFVGQICYGLFRHPWNFEDTCSYYYGPKDSPYDTKRHRPFKQRSNS